MKRILLALIVVVAGGAFFAHYQITSRVEDQMDKAVQVASLYGRLTYEGVSVSPDGSVAVNQIDFFPHAVSDKVHVDRIIVETGSPLALYNLPDRLKNRKLPEQLTLNIKGLAFDMDGPLLNLQRENQSDHLTAKLMLAGCGGRSQLSVDDQVAMGYDQEVVDIRIGYVHDKENSLLDLRSRVEFEDQTNIIAQASIDTGFVHEKATGLPIGTNGELKTASLSFEDRGLTTRLLEFCAGETGMTVDAYRKHHLQAWNAIWGQLGLAPSDSFSEAYASYVAHPGSTMELSIEPFPPLSMVEQNLSTDPDYLSGRLNPKVGVDGNMQPFQITKADLPTEDDSATAQAAPQPTQPEAIRSAPEPERHAAAKEPAALALNALGNHLNQSVRITLTSGETVEGRIQGVEGQRLKLQRRMYGGNMVVPIQFSAIQAVYRQ